MTRLLVWLLLFLSLPAAAQSGYHARSDVQGFIDQLVERHGFAPAELAKLFSRVRRADGVLEAIRPPPPAERIWADYRANFVNEKRIDAGLAFWRKNARALERAHRAYGVPAEIVVAIIGVETYYGRNMGRWRVVDALTTLAFDYPARAAFFRSELEQYLLLARELNLDVFSVRGSYAGAIGIPQFMPGSTRRYAVDFDGDGGIDLRGNPVDAVGSVANFLKEHGWRAGEAIQLPADGAAPEQLEGKVELIDLGSERRLGLHNFYVLTRYNRSHFYAAAVADLARALRSGYGATR
ncbi:MAG: lytic murein transglycosylase B [Betaproteobacteria bacterium]